MSFFSLNQGNRLPVAKVELTDASGVVNLTNQTVYFIYKSKYQTGVNPTTGTATIVSAVSGIAEYAWAASDTATAGIYYCYWMTSGTDGKTAHYPNDMRLRYVINPLL